MSGQLVQVSEFGFQNDDGTVDWTSGVGGLVDPANRRRILDRPSVESREDGWAYEVRHLDECVAVTRIRWDNPHLYATADLARLCAPWTRTEVAA